MTPVAANDSATVTRLAAQRLVACLQDLHAGPLVLPKIISLGEAAIPALETFLRGPSQSLYHPRALAAGALAAIGGNNSITALIRAHRSVATTCAVTTSWPTVSPQEMAYLPLQK